MKFKTTRASLPSGKHGKPENLRFIHDAAIYMNYAFSSGISQLAMFHHIPTN